jgi:hypothetical protein
MEAPKKEADPPHPPHPKTGDNSLFFIDMDETSPNNPQMWRFRAQVQIFQTPPMQSYEKTLRAFPRHLLRTAFSPMNPAPASSGILRVFMLSAFSSFQSLQNQDSCLPVPMNSSILIILMETGFTDRF